MKNVILSKMHLVNFKCFSDYTANFDGHVTHVHGRNGTGKTTLFDAFTWLLFGKSSDGRKDFNLKTIDRQGKVVENIPHEVSATIFVDGEEINLCRRLVEKWTKKRGSAVAEYTGNTEERVYNDVPCSVKEWNEKIENICPEQIFKFITNPLYFCQQKPDVQRAMLFRMAGNISDDEIASGNEDFTTLLNNLSGKTLDEYKKEISAKKKRIRAEIDDIPGRIDERKRDIPESFDWDALANALNEKTKQKNDITAKMADAVKAQEAVNAARMEKVNALFELRQKKSSLENGIRYRLAEEYDKSLQAKRETERIIEHLSCEIKSLEQSISTNNAEIAKRQHKRDELLKEYRDLKSSALFFNEKDFVCPACGRPLEADDIETKRREMAERFNKNKAEALDNNISKGKENNDRVKAIEADTEKLRNKIEEINANINALKSRPDFNAAVSAPDVSSAIAASEEIKSLDEQISALEKETSRAACRDEPDNGNDIIKERLRAIEHEIYEINTKLANKDVIDRNNKRVAELEKQLRLQSEELARLEGVEFTISEFSKAKTAVVDKRVNGMFHLVRFKLYDTQINGGEIETCEAVVDGVPYSDLNDAKKINAGLDIINAVCRHENVSAPIVIDNAESVNKIINTSSQQICLYVSEHDNLTIKNNIQTKLF